MCYELSSYDVQVSISNYKVCMTVELKLPKLKKRKKFLTKDVDKTMLQVGEILRGDVIKEWLKGKDPNGQTLKRGNKKYLTAKRKRGRSGKIDFNLSGDMQQSFSVKKYGIHAIVLFFNSAKERKKAKANYNKRKNMMKVGKKLRSKTILNFFKRMTR